MSIFKDIQKFIKENTVKAAYSAIIGLLVIFLIGVFVKHFNGILNYLIKSGHLYIYVILACIIVFLGYLFIRIERLSLSEIKTREKKLSKKEIEKLTKPLKEEYFLVLFSLNEQEESWVYYKSLWNSFKNSEKTHGYFKSRGDFNLILREMEKLGLIGLPYGMGGKLIEITNRGRDILSEITRSE